MILISIVVIFIVIVVILIKCDYYLDCDGNDFDWFCCDIDWIVMVMILIKYEGYFNLQVRFCLWWL